MADKPRASRLATVEIVVLVAAVLSASYYAWSANRIADESLALSRQLADIELTRAEAADSREAARDFIVAYQSRSCAEKLGLMQFPLRRFFSLHDGMPNVVLDQARIGGECAQIPDQRVSTYIVREIHVASASGPNEYSVTADIAYDTGVEDGAHAFDGSTMVHMTLVAPSGERVDSFDDLRLVAISEVVCPGGSSCD